MNLTCKSRRTNADHMHYNNYYLVIVKKPSKKGYLYRRGYVETTIKERRKDTVIVHPGAHAIDRVSSVWCVNKN